MKRALLIAGGTLGGLGAVLAITPPQLSNNSTSLGGGIELAPATTDPFTIVGFSKPTHVPVTSCVSLICPQA